MKIDAAKLIKQIMLCLVIFTLTSIGAPAHSFAGVPGLRIGASSNNAPDITKTKVNIFKILSVLDNKLDHKTRDQKLLEKAKEKLSTLDEKQIRLLASLSDRIANHDRSTSTEIAFLLVTALIVLS